MVTATSNLIQATKNVMPYRAGAQLAHGDFLSLRRQMLLGRFKWDSQVGDVTTLATFPLVMIAAHWSKLSQLAEDLARELSAAETELLHRPDLHGQLGLPNRIRQILKAAVDAPLTPAAGRCLRFDFHWTDDGWRISEVNSDVPGGFTEASSLPTLMAEHFPDLQTAGDPAAAWADAIASRMHGSHVALLAASGFIEDQQIMAYLANLLAARGFTPHLVGLQQLSWKGGVAYLQSAWHCGPLGGIVRFFQAEWLANRPRSLGWRKLFVGGETPVCNPASAILTESKRFPLVWNALKCRLPTWRALLPETRDPRDAEWKRDDGWLVKSALCNTGDTVSIRSLLTAGQWRSICRSVWWRPGNWVAQRRFAPVPLDTPAGLVYPCFGVYTIDGRAAGIYGRYSPRPIIDFAAIDVAVLIVKGGR